jgi:hypothetical protein
MRIEFTERYIEYDQDEIEKAESMGLERPKGTAKYRRVYVRLDDIFAPKEIPGKPKYCQIEFYDGTHIIIKGDFVTVTQQIDDREAQLMGDLDIEE